MLTGVFSAEFGRGAGVVSVSTKSGSNEFHGTVFDFIRNDVFDAHNFFAQRTAPTAPKCRSRPSAATSSAAPSAGR